MMRNHLFQLAFISFFAFQSKFVSQINPANNQVFLQSEIATVKIYLAQVDLDFILDTLNQNSDIEFPATFIYQSTLLNDTIQNVGFRLRGNTSRASLKKSFKVSFNEFVKGQKYYGLEKMNLNGEHNDVSIMRSKMNHELMTNANLIAPRSSYVQLFINDVFRGLYLNVEHIDEEFIQKRFSGNNTGNLYKAFWGANLTYWGTNASNYSSVYELKTNDSIPDYSGLINFISVLNNTSNANFPCTIESVFDVHNYLKTAAYEILVGHWDGYIFNNNNYYLYQRPSDGRFVFIEYDEDNTFGVDWFNIDWSTRNIYSWQASNPRPLFTKLMAVPYYKEIFTIYMEDLLQNVFNSIKIVPRFVSIQNFIKDVALIDTFKKLDYGFTNTDFLDAINVAWGNHIPQSLSEYVIDRTNSAFAQLKHQQVTDPCLNFLLENAKLENEKIVVKTVDILGQEINPNLRNCLKIRIYSDGSIQKVVEIE